MPDDERELNPIAPDSSCRIILEVRTTDADSCDPEQNICFRFGPRFRDILHFDLSDAGEESCFHSNPHKALFV
jgi:hypothetical protein